MYRRLQPGAEQQLLEHGSAGTGTDHLYSLSDVSDLPTRPAMPASARRDAVVFPCLEIGLGE